MEPAQQAPENQKYFKIRLASMHPNRKINFDVFIVLNQRYVLYMRSGSLFEGEKLEHFISRRADVFFVREEDRDVYKAYIKDRVHDEGLSAGEKAVILKESSFSLVEELFE